MPKSNPNLHEFIQRQETRPEVGTKISSLLIAPIQRIPRYLLLLKELKSLTPQFTYAFTELDGMLNNHVSNCEFITENINSIYISILTFQMLLKKLRKLSNILKR